MCMFFYVSTVKRDGRRSKREEGRKKRVASPTGARRVFFNDFASNDASGAIGLRDGASGRVSLAAAISHEHQVSSRHLLIDPARGTRNVASRVLRRRALMHHDQYSAERM